MGKMDIMKTIHVHVGSGRCGSTLIQALFNEPAMHQIFGMFGLRYLPEICMALGPRTPVPAFRAGEWEDFRARHFAPLAEEDVEDVFLTQENLFGVTWETGAANSCEASCDLIEYLTEGYAVKIVMLVRRQDTFIESLYNQLIKRQEVREFGDFLEDLPLANFDWAAVADVYARRFGCDNVTVLPFENSVVQTGGADSFFEAVVAALGIDQKINFQNIPTINPSLSPRVIEVQRLANQALTKDEAHALADWFETAIPKRPGDPHSLMEDGDRGRVLDTFRDSNKRLCADYMPGYDGTYYQGLA